ncbi:MAG: hypothetical protein M3126_06390 [Candidatus Eremiobacteraeota bacterium]|nr:hypothetical protein [Candidatus Eremiobacteraeota bacterium]
MIRIKVPLDIHAIATTACAAFAAATPMRLDRLVALAVREAQGPRAPLDRVERSVAATLAGLHAGHFTVDVDGRTFTDPKAVVVCTAQAGVRFFLGAATRSGKRSEILGSEL